MSLRMLLVIPFYHGDRGQVDRLGKWMGQLSGGKRIGEKVLFCVAPNADPTGVGNNFVGLFDEIKAVKQIVESNVEPGQSPWPRACNFQFCHLAKHIVEERKDIDAFYYFEPDNLPLTPDWWDKICAEYEAAGKPFWGIEAPFVVRDEGGQNPRVDGVHMIGTGIYPQNVWERLPELQEIEAKQPNRPWDVVLRDRVNPQCHFTKLVGHIHACRGFRPIDGLPHAVYRDVTENEFKFAPAPISPDAVLFHGCKDSSLRLLMGKKLNIPQTDPLTFVHAGDIGDVIYCLPSIRFWGGGILKFSEKGSAREKMSPGRVDLIAPLLLQQPYIKQIEMHDEGYADFDFRAFRIMHAHHKNLLEGHSQWVGCPPNAGKIPWITVVKKKLFQYVVNRTARYHNDKFPWQKIGRLGLDATFVGTVEEFEEMKKLWPTLSHTVTPTYLEAAQLIAGSERYIGNQSACYAIAEAMKHPRIQETWPLSKDCLFPDEKNAVYCEDEDLDLTLFGEKESVVPQHFDVEQFLNHPKLASKIDEIVSRRLEQLLK